LQTFSKFYEIEEENKHLKIIAWIESPGVCKLLTPVNRGLEVCYSGELLKFQNIRLFLDTRHVAITN